VAEAACLFCDIVAGREPASRIYEDDAVLAFMDLRQVAHGHCLVIPKQHIRDVFGMDDATGAAIASALRRVATAAREAFAPDGLSIWQSNEPPWQEVLHLHFHIMPRYHGDGLMRIYPQLPSSESRRALDEQAAQLREALGGVE
jgi:histidine triad (HIT) family protein